ncbi:MAG: acyl carrier protein [Gemmatimonadota bacterium]|jgi:acyl carrier protein
MTPDAPTTEAQIASEVTAFLQQSYPDGSVEISEDLRLLEEGVIDSLSLLELVGFIESQFGIFVDDHEVDLEHFGCVRSMAEFVAAKLNR